MKKPSLKLTMPSKRTGPPAVLLTESIKYVKTAGGGVPDLAEMTTVKTLGRGGFADVVLMEAGGALYAVKYHAMEDPTLPVGCCLEALGNEKARVGVVGGHLLMTHAVFECQKTKMAAIVMEYAEGGDLARAVAASGSLPTVADIALILHSLVEALRDLSGTPHNDIKPDNIFITCPSTVKLGDFGLTTHSPPPACCQPWASPERRSPTNPPTVKSDIYTLGLLAVWLALGSLPDFSSTHAGVVAQLGEIDNDLADLVETCMEAKVKDRVGVEELASHPFLSKRGTTLSFLRGWKKNKEEK